MKKLLTLTILALCAVVFLAGDSQSWQPPAASGRRGLLDVLRVGQRVTLVPVVGGRVWDVQFFHATDRKAQRPGTSVVFEIGEDFIGFRRETQELFVPVSSIRSMYRYRSPDDPAFKFTTQLQDKLDAKIDISLRRTPFYEAFNIIGKKIGIKFEIEANALKFEGYTQNMTQDLVLNLTPARQVLAALLGKYKPLILVKDAKRQVVVVTTKAARKARPVISLGDGKNVSKTNDKGSKTVVKVEEWKKVLSKETLEQEIKNSRDGLTAKLASLNDFKRSFPSIVQEAEWLAALLTIAAEHPEGVRWKDRLPSMVVAVSKLAETKLRSTKMDYDRVKQNFMSFDRLYDLDTPPNRDGQKVKLPTLEIDDVFPALMKRNQRAFQTISKADVTAKDAKAQRLALAHEATMMAVVAKLVTRPGSGYADDVGFLNHAAGLGSAAAKLKAAAAQGNVQVLRAAITLTGSRCAACHAEFR